VYLNEREKWRIGMCGIWAFLGDRKEISVDAEKHVKTLLPRGPEYMSVVDLTNATLGFTRLAINGLTPAGHQPMVSPSGRWTVVCNGEIYNYKELARRFDIPDSYLGSDCFVIPFLLEKYHVRDVCRLLDGVFAFAAWDNVTNELTVARDMFGVRPLFQRVIRNKHYYLPEHDHYYAFASEVKALTDISGGDNIFEFPPGQFAIYDSASCYDRYLHKQESWTQITWLPEQLHHDRASCAVSVRALVESAVKKRMLSDRPVGALLSGGLDSSLVCALAAGHLKQTGQWLHTFSIGLGQESPDILAARKVAKHIGSIHHEVIFSQEEFLAAIPSVIRSVETYDITTIRASVGNWLIGKWIKENTDIKVILNGDGSDEIFGGYLYFYNAPGDIEFMNETERLLQEIHRYDGKRSERSMAAHGLEARTPFLDRQLVDAVRRMPASELRPIKGSCCEKKILRDAFSHLNLLPEDVLWRRKEAFSDGVSSGEKSWFQVIHDYCSSLGDQDVDDHIKRLGMPDTAEAKYYLSCFLQEFGTISLPIIEHMWMPSWSPEAKDPSARTLALY
jgi:asparagine synthase (glutamine-hydrolysing)